MKKPSVETEIKLAIGTAAKGRSLLRRYGFAVIKPRVFEQNLVLDDELKSLRERGLLLRVRGAGKVITCTFKGVESAGRHKSREEHEFEASDLDACLASFACLGFREVFRYEKYRTEFARGKEPGHAVLDETPIGTYLELEGPAAWIDRTATELGFTTADYVTTSYARLYTESCEASGVPPGDMTFSDS